MEPAFPPPSSTGTNLRLGGAKLPFARAAFVGLSLATVIFFSLGVPLDFRRYTETIDAETLSALRELGLSTAFYATYQTGLVVLLAIAFTTAGLIIAWNKSDDWLALLVAFTLIGQGANAFDPLQWTAALPGFQMPVRFVIAMVLIGLPLSCYLFPDGKIQKRWMLYVAGLWSVWLMVSIFWPSFPINLLERGGNATLVYLLSLLAVLSTGIYAQVYRYRSTDNPVKREQLKWIVFGVAVGILTGVGVSLFMAFFELADPSRESYLVVDMFTQTLSVVAQFTVPVAVVFSILKYRLYDIELVINRSLIYGSLTVILAGVFGILLFGLQAAYRAITHQTDPPTIAIVISTLVVSSIFQPTRKALRRFVNRKIYGMDVDFEEIERRNQRLEQVAHRPTHTLTSIGGYKGLELIARGGMGEVYKARHPNLNRAVAIKVLSTYLIDDPALNKRFTREAKAMAQLRHPNIITIYDFGDQDGLPYIVMEYLTGETLSQILAKRERLPLDESLPLLQDLASALDYAHGQGVIHRDIKPSNVIVEPITTLAAGRTQRAILMDFGIARFASENTFLTASGDILGTVDYISPEQIHGTTELDSRADLYSFGVMTYQVLTGKKPFERNNTWAMIRSHLEEPPPDPCIHVSMPEGVAGAILRALAKKPEARFASIGEFVAELGKNC
ncbi:MAG TPA: serine/threonine-protein kinase [Anaerolineales bacterium]|nr:serine/threonine-protein kinase [Anaerolineales bacterium]